MHNGWSTRLRIARASLLLAAYLPGLAAAQDLQGWGVDSSVSALQLVRVEQVGSTAKGPLMVLSLKNISQEPISALVVIIPGGGNRLTDYFAREPLAPGATYSFPYGVRDSQTSERILGISAVVFVDGTSQGDRSQIEFIKAYRLGVTMETARINRVLESFGTEDVLKGTSVASVIEAVGGPPRSAAEAVESLRQIAGNQAAALDMAASDRKTRVALLQGVIDTCRNAHRDLAEIGEQRKSPAPESAQVAASQAGVPTSLPAYATQIRTLIAKQKAELEAMR